MLRHLRTRHQFVNRSQDGARRYWFCEERIDRNVWEHQGKLVTTDIKGGEEAYLHLLVFRPQSAAHLETVHPRHLEIKQHDVIVASPVAIHCVDGIVESGHEHMIESFEAGSHSARDL